MGSGAVQAVSWRVVGSRKLKDSMGDLSKGRLRREKTCQGRVGVWSVVVEEEEMEEDEEEERVEGRRDLIERGADEARVRSVVAVSRELVRRIV